MSLGELGTNCYIVYKNSRALIIDPGAESERVINFLNEKQLTPEAIVLTHAHFDHIGAVDDVRKAYSIPVYLHKDEEEWLTEPSFNGSGRFPRTPIVTSPPDAFIVEGTMDVGSFTFDVFHTPGHSPGSTTLIFKESGLIISGDVLFNQGIGRTDLYGGNTEQLITSIQTKVFQLDDTFTVYPGHGNPTTIGSEKVNNPFVSPID